MEIKLENNKLQIIVKESGLEITKANVILERFKDYFQIAGEWEQKAKNIVVTNETQKADMAMARVGRLFLRDKRLEIENTRKELKEQALREGKAIDGIANVLKALIVPTEEYLEKQEKFIEFQEAEKAEKIRLEIEARMEQERIAKEKADAEERERIRLENERLKQEAEQREIQMKVEREKAETEKKKQEKILAEQKAKAESERKALEEKSRKEKELQERALAEQRMKAEKEKKALEEKARKEREVSEAKAKKLKEEQEEKIKAEKLEKERLQKILDSQITCPHCGKKLTKDGKKITETIK
jgi:hypothetical protein